MDWYTPVMSEIDLYDYQIPRERIAQEPLATRSDARLMLVNRASGEIEHQHVRDLPDLLRSEDTLVLNDSRVIPARMVGFRTSTKGRWQGLFLREDPQSGIWEVLTKTRGKLVEGRDDHDRGSKRIARDAVGSRRENRAWPHACGSPASR